MKISTQDLIGATLDWAVAKCEGLPLRLDPMGFGSGVQGGWWVWYGTPSNAIVGYRPKRRGDSPGYSPSTDWSEGGPIIEREHISVEFGRAEFKSKWIAYKLGEPHEDNPEGGPTPLIAAMRCYAASKLGEEVEVPDELSAI